MTNQSNLPRLAVDVLADYTNTTFATRREAIEAYITAAELLADSHLLASLLASHNYKVASLPA